MPNTELPLLLAAFLASCAASAPPVGLPFAQVPSEPGFGNPAPWEGSISADRPSFGVGTQAIPVGRFQAEFGYTVADDEDATSHAIPHTLLRVGVVRGVEARLSTPGFVAAEGAEDGVGDLLVGARFEVRPQDGAVPELAIQPSISLPTGDASGTDSFNPELVVPMAWSLDDVTSLNANVGLQVRTLDVDRETDLVLSTSVLLGHALTDSVSVFAEYFAIYPERVTGQHALDFGAAYLWGPDLQLDAAVGFGLNDAAGDVFATFGFSSRF